LIQVNLYLYFYYFYIPNLTGALKLERKKASYSVFFRHFKFRIVFSDFCYFHFSNKFQVEEYVFCKKILYQLANSIKFGLYTNNAVLPGQEIYGTQVRNVNMLKFCEIFEEYVSK
jgi:hypothetical protein